VFYNGISYFSSNIFGQPLFYGHIAMIKRNTLEECGFSFPNLVGEDHAFSLEAIFKGYKICYAPNIICGCEEPPNLIAQRTKIIKFVGGDYEVMKKY
jgi:cellulose synthase/poly-beta-1,6-N-acetylglucosamine synthase-like glycosyltransferase